MLILDRIRAIDAVIARSMKPDVPEYFSRHAVSLGSPAVAVDGPRHNDPFAAEHDIAPWMTASFEPFAPALPPEALAA